ncbi:MAG: nickel-type superoxide dismutase maturation protease [Acidimicrobiales bacterium]
MNPGPPRRRGRVRGATVVGAAAALAALALPLLGLRRLVVEGDSMLPTLEPGDRLLFRRRRRVRVGDLVAVPDPRSAGRLLVKRVHACGDGFVEVRGDNPAASTDSRAFGLVPRTAVRGTLVRRYAPAERAGPVR